MSLYEPIVVAAWLLGVLADTDLTALLPGGVHETDVSEGVVSFGSTAQRQETPYLVFAHLAGGEDVQGVGGTILVGDLDYAVQVMYRPGEQTNARQALVLVQGLLEGVEAQVAASGNTPAHAITVRGRGVLPRIADRPPAGRLIYSEGRRWLFRVQRI
jgi:hypothetical protein